MAVLLAFPFFIHGLLSRSHDQSLDPPNPPCPPATMVSPKSPSAVLRTASLNIIESGRFSSASWKPRRLELHPDVLIIIKVSDPNHSNCHCTLLISVSFHRTNGHFYPFAKSPNLNDLIWQITPCYLFLITKRTTT